MNHLKVIFLIKPPFMKIFHSHVWLPKGTIWDLVIHIPPKHDMHIWYGMIGYNIYVWKVLLIVRTYGLALKTCLQRPVVSCVVTSCEFGEVNLSQTFTGFQLDTTHPVRRRSKGWQLDDWGSIDRGTSILRKPLGVPFATALCLVFSWFWATAMYLKIPSRCCPSSLAKLVLQLQ